MTETDSDIKRKGRERKRIQASEGLGFFSSRILLSWLGLVRKNSSSALWGKEKNEDDVRNWKIEELDIVFCNCTFLALLYDLISSKLYSR